MTDVEIAQVTALARCRFSPGSSAKSFVGRLAIREPSRELSPKESAFLDRLAHQYRKQIGRCMSIACIACHQPPAIDREEIRVALDSVLEERGEYDEKIGSWRREALARVNRAYGTTFAHPYEYATRCAPESRRAHTLGDIYCRFCGERLFSQVKQPHKLVASSDEAQRHLTICALQILAEMKPLVPPGHRALPFEQLWREDQP